MSSPFSAFHDDDGAWSMTRTIAFVFAIVVSSAIIIYACKVHEIGWPLTMLGISAMFAVPIQAFFRYLQEWFSSSPGQKLLGSLLSKVTGSTFSSVTTTHSEEKTDG